MQDRDLIGDRKQLNTMALTALEAARLDFDQTSALRQAVFGTFFFGMISAYGMAARMSLTEVHAVALLVFQDSLHYAPNAAVEAVHACINATRPDAHDTMNAILHRGIDGYAQFVAGDLEGLAGNLSSLLALFDEADPG